MSYKRLDFGVRYAGFPAVGAHTNPDIGKFDYQTIGLYIGGNF